MKLKFRNLECSASAHFFRWMVTEEIGAPARGTTRGTGFLSTRAEQAKGITLANGCLNLRHAIVLVNNRGKSPCPI